MVWFILVCHQTIRGLVMLLLKAIQRVCVVDMTNLTKVYESVVLAEATKLCKWSGNGKFYAPVIYNLSFPTYRSGQKEKYASMEQRTDAVCIASSYSGPISGR